MMLGALATAHMEHDITVVAQALTGKRWRPCVHKPDVLITDILCR
jgi:hypothetical protein